MVFRAHVSGMLCLYHNCKILSTVLSFVLARRIMWAAENTICLKKRHLDKEVPYGLQKLTTVPFYCRDFMVRNSSNNRIRNARIFRPRLLATHPFWYSRDRILRPVYLFENKKPPTEQKTITKTNHCLCFAVQQIWRFVEVKLNESMQDFSYCFFCDFSDRTGKVCRQDDAR